MTEAIEMERPAEQSAPEGLWERLKSGSREAHSRLDGRIMAGEPFANRERYGLFVQVQHDFHALLSPLYTQPELARLLPDLAGRDRLELIEQDLRDLGFDIADSGRGTAPELLGDLPTAIGWLYVAEGSKLGAAFLLKWAIEKLDLSEEFGARHLAGAPEGRGLHWKKFTAAIDAIPFTAEEEARVIAGASAGFDKVLSFVERRFFGAAG